MSRDAPVTGGPTPSPCQGVSARGDPQHGTEVTAGRRTGVLKGYWRPIAADRSWRSRATYTAHQRRGPARHRHPRGAAHSLVVTGLRGSSELCELSRVRGHGVSAERRPCRRQASHAVGGIGASRFSQLSEPPSYTNVSKLSRNQAPSAAISAKSDSSQTCQHLPGSVRRACWSFPNTALRAPSRSRSEPDRDTRHPALERAASAAGTGRQPSRHLCAVPDTLIQIGPPGSVATTNDTRDDDDSQTSRFAYRSDASFTVMDGRLMGAREVAIPGWTGHLRARPVGGSAAGGGTCLDAGPFRLRRVCLAALFGSGFGSRPACPVA